MSLDGYIVFAPPHLDDPVVALLEKRGIPYVTWDRDPGRPDFRNWVAHDDAASTRVVLDHLAAAGAGSIAYVGGTDRNAWNFDCEAAYVAWCLETGKEPRIYHVPERDGVEGGRQVGARILGDGLPGAVFCLTGRHASGAAQAMQERGVRIPGDLLVCTGSDSEHSRQHKPPRFRPLTWIFLPRPPRWLSDSAKSWRVSRGGRTRFCWRRGSCTANPRRRERPGISRSADPSVACSPSVEADGAPFRI